MQGVLVEHEYDKLHIIMMGKYTLVMNEGCYEECEMIVFSYVNYKKIEKKHIIK
jgi:hypothetical protein